MTSFPGSSSHSDDNSLLLLDIGAVGSSYLFDIES